MNSQKSENERQQQPQSQASRSRTGKRFLFVQSSKTGSMKDQATQHAIKKYVMRDIGKARRIYHVSDDGDDDDLDEGTPSNSKSRPKEEGQPRETLSTQLIGALPHSEKFRRTLSHAEEGSSNTSLVGISDLHGTRPSRLPPLPGAETLEPVRCGTPAVPTLSYPSPYLAACELSPLTEAPLELTPSMQDLLSNIFNHALPQDLIRYRDIWYSLGAQDNATFCQVLSNFCFLLLSSSCRLNEDALVANVPMLHEESLYYHQIALEHVKAKLGSSNTNEGTSDGILSTVAAFICYAQLTNDWTALAAHKNGLKAILRKRGGIELLESNKPLSSVIIFVDALGHYTPYLLSDILSPYNPLAPYLSPQTSSQSPQTTSLLRAWSIRYPSPPQRVTLPSVFSHIVDLIAYINSQDVLVNDSEAVSRLLDPLVAALLAVRPSVEAHAIRSISECVEAAVSDLQKAFNTLVCCAALLFVWEIGSQAGSARPVVAGYHAKRVRVAVEALGRGGYEWGELFPLKVWAITVGVLEAEEGEDRVSLEEEFGNLLREREWSVEELKGMLKGVCWLEAVFGEKLEKAVDSVWLGAES